MPQSQSSPERSPEALQRDILYVLTEPARSLWAVDELARELEDPFIADQLGALDRAGLIHRTSDGYVFATTAAARQIELVGRTL